MSILVCYLQPAGELYEEKAQTFMSSYEDHDAGEPHDHTLILKDGAIPVRPWPANWHDNEGLDIGSLQQVAYMAAGYEWIVWLGAHARILTDGWLSKLRAGAELDGVGAAGATASFEAGVSDHRPNPHLRTTAFMINPGVLNSLGMGYCRDRLDTYRFEHGYDSMTSRLRQRGLDVVVVGKSGRVYHEAEWDGSLTYRQGDQKDLLIADKMTDMYASAEDDERIALARMAGWDP